MRTTGKMRRTTRVLGIGLLVGALTLGVASTTASAEDSETSADGSGTPTDGPPTAPSDPGSEEPQGPTSQSDGSSSSLAAVTPPPYGAAFPIVQETNFARPVKALSSDANSDFSQLDDLERLIRGTYKHPNGAWRSIADRQATRVYMSMSRMEYSKRVGRVLIEAANNGVNVVFVHGQDSQSAASRYLQSKLNSASYRGIKTGYFKICAKGQSLACLSSLKGGIIHTKSLIISTSQPGNIPATFTQNGEGAKSAVWFGSANIGGPSGEHTWNNGQTIYNDRKIYTQVFWMFQDLIAERNVNNGYPGYIAANSVSSKPRYGYAGAESDGYVGDFAHYGMFYSNLSNMTIYASPIKATPTNGKDPIMAALNRVIPDKTCRIRVQENRWKYRRLSIAQKLVELSNGGCEVSVIAYQDDLLVNRVQHCQIYIRICRPILDELRTANVHINAAWAKPHDKIILIDALMKKNPENPDERIPNGGVGEVWPSGHVERLQMVQAGSAALTGSNLVASDEVTTESLDSHVYADYLEHWRSISRSVEYRNYPY